MNDRARQELEQDQEIKSPYEMRLDLRVLDHLGIRLYSNAAAVLSEAVANSWDADAKHVSVSLTPQRIVIEDDGVGMTLGDINDRFLKVGYDKRTTEGGQSTNGRSFMGRKGIGKLSLFSIADQIEVFTARGGEQHAFRMRTDDIKAAVKRDKRYRPVPIDAEPRAAGTKIVLTELKKRRTAQSSAALRKRIARRFSIIGYRGVNGDSFDVSIDGKVVGPEDRDDYQAIEFLWEFGGEHRIPVAACPGLRSRSLLPGIVDETRSAWQVRGWLGAAAQPKKLRSEESGAMNGLVVIARGRLIQENVLDRLGFSRILTSYLTGQIEADFLDTEDEEDIATSDRQRLIEDDERYVALLAFLRRALLSISDEWTRNRNEVRGKEAVEELPALREWLENLPVAQRDPARRMIGVIKGVELDNEEERRELYKSGVLAFERLRLREASHKLGEMPELTAQQLLTLLSDLAAIEGSMYRDIVRSRVDVIRKFEGLIDNNARERVLQDHLFENLWLLDPGWERAAGSERIEQTLKKEYAEFHPDLTDEQSKGRADIRYKTNGGQHIIVELKRADRKLSLPEVIDQGQKYVSALKKCVRAATGEADPNISIVFVLGQPIAEESQTELGGIQHVKNMLQPFNARVVQYEQLVHGARVAYDEYLNRTAQVDKLDQLVQRLSVEPDS